MLLKNSDVLLTKELHPGLLPITADYAQMVTIVQNLIINSLHAFEDNDIRIDRKIRIVTTPMKGGIEISYYDNAGGMPEHVKNRIFDPFFTTKKVGEGTGLGLSVTYAIVEKYGGNIRFETRLPEGEGGNSGTTFFVALPPETSGEAKAGEPQGRTA